MLYIIVSIIIKIQLNSRLVKSQHIISNIQNYLLFIETLIAKLFQNCNLINVLVKM